MFGKLISIEMSLRGNRPREFVGRLLRKVWPSFRLSRLLLRAGGSEQRIQVFGKQMYVDLWDSAVSTNLFLNRVWEPEETNVIAGLLHKGDVFVDIGANIGYLSSWPQTRSGTPARFLPLSQIPGIFAIAEECRGQSMRERVG
jgi:hypothetical protein